MIAPVNHQWLTLWRDANLPLANLTLQITTVDTTGAVIITVTSDAVAPMVMIHCADVNDFGWFSDNGVTLFPGVGVNVTYTPRPHGGEGGDTSEAHVWSESSFYAVSVNGVSW